MLKKIAAALLALSLILGLGVAALADAKAQTPVYSGILVQEDGTILATDTWNKVIWKITDGEAEIFAGKIPVADLSGEPQGRYHDDEPAKAFFMEPTSIVPFLEGYAVTDSAANVVRYVTDKAVMTLGGSGKAGLRDGMAQYTNFDYPTGLATDGEGHLYIADTGNGAVRVMSEGGYVSTYLTGLAEPTGLAYSDGSLFVVESGKSRVLKVTDGKAEVLCGSFERAEDEGEYYGGFADGKAENAKFDHPASVAVSEDGTVYVSDPINHAVRYLKNGRVYSLKRGDGVSRPVSPNGLFLSGDRLYIADGAGDILSCSTKEKVFRDVPEDVWFAAGTAESVRLGLINGTSATTFSPEEPTTRAMFVTMLSRLHSSIDGTARIDGDTVFNDMTEEKWWSAAARWAADAGIVKGSDGNFAPNEPITREQMATMLLRYAAYLGIEVDTAPVPASFPDSGDVSTWAGEAVDWALSSGLLQGSDGKLLPKDPATRAQTVTVLLRFIEALENDAL